MHLSVISCFKYPVISVKPSLIKLIFPNVSRLADILIAALLQLSISLQSFAYF